MSKNLESEERSAPKRFLALNPEGDKPQIKPRVSFPTYLKSSAWGSHNARDFQENAWRADRRRQEPEAPEEESYALKFGTIYHAYVLDRTHYTKTYVEIDDPAQQEMIEAHNQVILEKGPPKFTKALATYKAWTAAGNTDSELTDDIKAALAEDSMREKLIDEAPSSSTNVYKAWCQMQRDNGLLPVSSHIVEQVVDMAGEIEATEDARAILKKQGRSETSIFTPVTVNLGQGRKSTIWIKCRPDWIPTKGNMIWDLKSCQDASEDGFGRACETYDYYFQLAFHLTVCQAAGLEKNYGGWIAQESKWPYAVAVRPARQDRLEVAFKEVKKTLIDLARCEADGVYPKYATTEPTLPTWKEREVEAILENG